MKAKVPALGASLLFVVCVLGAGSASATSAANLVVNGDFTGGGSGWSTTQTDGNFVWRYGHGYVYTGCEGSSCIAGNPGEIADLFQTLSTTAGTSYTLSFEYMPGYGTPNELEVLFGGNTVTDLVDVTGQCGFITYTFNGLAANSSSTVLDFLGRQDLSFDGLTDVYVASSDPADPAPTPEPSAFFLLGTGMLDLALLATRKVFA